MIRTLFALMLFASAAWSVCTKISMPTDYAVVTNGTRANLKANFTETQIRVNPCMDSVDEVRARLSGYSTSLAITSLENLRLRLDGDASATAKFILETSSGDSLFRISEDSTAKFFGALFGTTAAFSGAISSGGAPTFSSLTASLPVFTDGSKALASNSMTGTGAVMMSVSPTTTGTLTAASGAFSGSLTLTPLVGTGTRVVTSTSSGVLGNATTIAGANTWSDAQTFAAAPTWSALTASLPVFTNGSKVATSNAMTGTGNVVMSAGPTLSGTVTIAGGALLNSGSDLIIRNTGGSPAFTKFQNSSSTDLLTIKQDGTVNGVAVVLTDNLTVGGTTASTGVMTASAGLTLGGRFIDKTTSITSNTTLGTSHSTVFASATGGSFTLTLPAASGNTGLTYTIYKTDASSNTVTADGNASETIGGATTVILGGNASNSVLEIVCDGSNWQIRRLYEEGTFTITAQGLSTSPTATAKYIRNGKLVTVYFGNAGSALSGTSDSTGYTLTGAPANIWPSADRKIRGGMMIPKDNGSVTTSELSSQGFYVNTSGVFVGFFSSSTTGFTATGTKGLEEAGSLSVSGATASYMQ